MSRRALISGISGQDGALLARHLLGLGYEIIGASRSPEDRGRLFRLDQLGILNQVTMVSIDTDRQTLLQEHQPTELYILEGQSSVAHSFQVPHETIASNGLSTLDWLEAVRLLDFSLRLYQASSAEIFGASSAFSREETSPIHPRSPYAVSKLFSHFATINYREAYGLFACCGILFNHESALRGPQFVTQKIARGAATWKLGKREPLQLGNLNASRDWGHAEDFVRGMHLMLQAPEPDDYVLSTGQLHSVRDFVNSAYASIGEELRWDGSGVEEKAYTAKGELCVEVSETFFRPSDMQHSLGNSIKARNRLGWKPTIDFDQLVAEMVSSHLK